MSIKTSLTRRPALLLSSAAAAAAGLALGVSGRRRFRDQIAIIVGIEMLG